MEEEKAPEQQQQQQQQQQLQPQQIGSQQLNEGILSKVTRKVFAISEKEQICYVSNIFQLLQSSDLPFALTEKEDIIKDIYEGGFKVWECTMDMLLHFAKINIDFTGKNIMDLGCGHGLLGIYALQHNANSVVFQDFNYEVLSIAVRLNLWLNGLLGTPEKTTELQNKLVYLSGDWGNLAEKVASNTNEIAFFENRLVEYANSFDVILLSEVIYNTANYKKIALVILALLKNDGVCYLANKMYYFGVGGSMPEFKQYLAKNHGLTLSVQSVEFINNKKGNVREIIAVRKIIN